MNPEQLDALYRALAEALAEALARTGEDRASLLLATLALDLLARHDDYASALAAIERAARLGAT